MISKALENRLNDPVFSKEEIIGKMKRLWQECMDVPLSSESLILLDRLRLLISEELVVYE